MAPKMTTADAFNHDELTFENLQLILFHAFNDHPFLFLASIRLFVTLVFFFIWKRRSRQQQTGPLAGGEKSVEEKWLQERDIGDEEAAEQLVIFDEKAGMHRIDGEDPLPIYDGRP